MPLGHHLRAHQHVDFARMHRLQLLLQHACAARGVAIDAAHTRLR